MAEAQHILARKAGSEKPPLLPGRDAVRRGRDKR